jgi:hypothetical protein
MKLLPPEFARGKRGWFPWIRNAHGDFENSREFAKDALPLPNVADLLLLLLCATSQPLFTQLAKLMLVSNYEEFLFFRYRR